MNECCSNCRLRFGLTKFDYSQGGCKHTNMDGYICMAFSDERQAVWMVGEDPEKAMCECYMPLKELGT